jgi:hypothetical protein
MADFNYAVSAIFVLPADTDAATVEKFLREKALPAAEQATLTRITLASRQSVMKGEDKENGHTYYLWRAELDLMSERPNVIDRVWAAMQEQLTTQNIVLTSPLLVLQEEPS